MIIYTKTVSNGIRLVEKRCHTTETIMKIDFSRITQENHIGYDGSNVYGKRVYNT